MNRKLLIQVTTPAVVIGLLLLVTCLVGAWYVQRLQANLAKILSENVISQEAAQELEIRVRQLRFHSFSYLIDPTISRKELIDQDHANFEKALRVAQSSANTASEQRIVREIETGYQQYHQEIDHLLALAAGSLPRTELIKLVDAHHEQLQHVVNPSQELLRLNKEMMVQVAQESQRVAGHAQLIMIFLGIAGPLSGVIIGYGITRGISRSIYQLSVRVRDIRNRLEQDVASVRIEADGDLQSLDQQLQYVIRQVEEITERQNQQQREMLRAEQLAAVGQLAASVAHEVRNPLTSVKMLVELAIRPKDAKPLTTNDLKVIHGEVTRLEKTIQSFLDFARLPKPRKSECDVCEIANHTVELVRARAKQQKVEVNVLAQLKTMPAFVDRDQLCTVLVNLCLNALDAMPQGGTLEIQLEVSNQNEAILRVMDTGSGIPAEINDRLFTPFTSTKQTGTGLGLSLSRRIIEEHGGSLSASNRPQGGACMTVSLPKLPKTPAGINALDN
jgi:signal transduction histidine kinase